MKLHELLENNAHTELDNIEITSITDDFQHLAENLYIKECYANEGVVLKRFMPRAKGSASSIFKRTSHITVVVSDER